MACELYLKATLKNKKNSFSILASLTLLLAAATAFAVVFGGKECVNLWCLKQVLYCKDTL